MQKLFMLTFEHAPNPRDFPLNWPAELLIDPETAPGPPWVETTREEFEAYKLAVGYNPPPPPEPIYPDEEPIE